MEDLARCQRHTATTSVLRQSRTLLFSPLVEVVSRPWRSTSQASGNWKKHLGTWTWNLTTRGTPPKSTTDVSTKRCFGMLDSWSGTGRAMGFRVIMYVLFCAAGSVLGFGALKTSQMLASLHRRIPEDPEDWVRIYVSSSCKYSHKALEAASRLSSNVVVVPLDRDELMGPACQMTIEKLRKADRLPTCAKGCGSSSAAGATVTWPVSIHSPRSSSRSITRSRRARDDEPPRLWGVPAQPGGTGGMEIFSTPLPPA